MSDWPKDVIDLSAFGTFSTAGEGSPLADAASAVGGIFNSDAACTASLATFVPIVVRRQVTVYQLGWFNGNTASGNVDVGVYDRNWNRLVSSGSTAQGTISVVQAVDTADVTLPPGLYYLAQVLDNGTGHVFQSNLTASYLRAAGVMQQAAAFPLPATVTPVVPTSINAPLIFGAIEGILI